MSVVYIFLIDESVLMDLKALLVEAKQKVPPVLQVLQTGDETMLDIGGKSHCYKWLGEERENSEIFSSYMSCNNTII